MAAPGVQTAPALAALSLDLAQQRLIGPGVLVMWVAAGMVVAGAHELGGIIHALLPASSVLSAGATAPFYAISLALTALALYPTLKRPGHP